MEPAELKKQLRGLRTYWDLLITPETYYKDPTFWNQHPRRPETRLDLLIITEVFLTPNPGQQAASRWATIWGPDLLIHSRILELLAAGPKFWSDKSAARGGWLRLPEHRLPYRLTYSLKNLCDLSDF